jgi:hypothetical protein
MSTMVPPGFSSVRGRGEGKHAGRVEDEIESFREGGRVEAETHDRFDAELARLVGRRVAAAAGDRGSPRPGELGRGPAHPAQAPVDEDRLPGPDSRRGLIGGHANGRQGGGLLVGKVHRFEHDRLLLDRDHLGERPRLPEPGPAEYRVAGLQAGDAGADRLDDSGEVVPHRPGKGAAGHQLHLAVADLPVQRVGSRRTDADENLIRTRPWWLELSEPHHLRAAVAVVLKALHEAYSFEISVA